MKTISKGRKIVMAVAAGVLVLCFGFVFFYQRQQQVAADNARNAKVVRQLAAINKDYNKEIDNKDRASRLSALKQLEGNYADYKLGSNKDARLTRLYTKYITSEKNYFAADDQKALSGVTLNDDAIKRSKQADIQRNISVLTNFHDTVVSEKNVVYSTKAFNALYKKVSALSGKYSDRLTAIKQEEAKQKKLATEKKAKEEAAAKAAQVAEINKNNQQAKQTQPNTQQAQQDQNQQQTQQAHGQTGNGYTSSNQSTGATNAGSTTSAKNYNNTNTQKYQQATQSQKQSNNVVYGSGQGWQYDKNHNKIDIHNFTTEATENQTIVTSDDGTSGGFTNAGK